MLLVSEVIKLGFDTFPDMEAVCPYPADDPLKEEGFHGAESIGLVRVGIDWPKMWQIGWNLAEKLELESFG